MRTNEFIEYLLKKGRDLVSHPQYSRFSPVISTITGLYKFPCVFKENKCHVAKREACCCHGCELHVGYFSYNWPNNLNVLKFYAKHYQKNVGFWRKNGGCALPREARSTVCVNYICPQIDNEFREANSKDLIRFHKLVIKYNTIPSFLNHERDKKQVKEIEENLRKASVKLMNKYHLEVPKYLNDLWN